MVDLSAHTDMGMVMDMGYENRDREINWYTQVKRSPTVYAKIKQNQKAEPEATRTPHAGVSGEHA